MMRQAALDSTAQARLIIGAPGVGKTFFGCELAECAIESGKIVNNPCQKVLFLTFSRNAVARIRQLVNEESAKSSSPGRFDDLQKPNREDRIRIDTFAGFFWWLVESYGRYAHGVTSLRPWFLGPRRVGGELVPDGHIGYTFNEAQSAAFATLQVREIRELISDIYPLVIIDEHQDVDDQLHEFILLLGENSHLILLRGPGQCIYGQMKQFSPKVVLERTKAALTPEIFPISSLGGERQRHCPEIANFVAQYDCGQTCRYDGRRTRLTLVRRLNRNNVPNELETDAAFALREMRASVKRLAPKRRPSFAVLSSTNNGVAALYNRLVTGRESYKLYPVKADLLFDDTKILRYGRLILSLLCSHWVALRKSEVRAGSIASEIASLASDSPKVSDLSSPSLWLPFAERLIQLASKQRKPTDGDDLIVKLGSDLKKINDFLRAKKESYSKKGIHLGTPSTPFDRSDSHLLDYLANYLVGLIGTSVESKGSVDIPKARKSFESVMQQRIIFEKLGISSSVEVMTIHKSKGREFDGVVLVLEDNHKALWKEGSQTSDKELDDLYRVAISRARHALWVIAYEDALQNAKPAIHRLLKAGTLIKIRGSKDSH
ncbi:MAG: AAA family ATPase [Syntrophobacteraceae bacterium]